MLVCWPEDNSELYQPHFCKRVEVRVHRRQEKLISFLSIKKKIIVHCEFKFSCKKALHMEGARSPSLKVWGSSL
ncbi:hypothetical protein Sjap_007681 [Stephania japonica]|uniref:Uncharacterized protein n=1 Tax=Stephania japonica TaxID=461633 RepID=A0AAP0JQF1_9MAGN